MAVKGLCFLLTGLPGAGKTTLAEALWHTAIRPVTMLDGDKFRHRFYPELGWSAAERSRHLNCIGWVAAQVTKHGGCAIISVVAPAESDRQQIEDIIESQSSRYVLIHVSTPLSVCEARDTKGLYAKARAGEIENFTGVNGEYQVPVAADEVIDCTECDAISIAIKLWEKWDN